MTIYIGKGISKGKDTIIVILIMEIREIGEKKSEETHICRLRKLEEK